MDGFLGIDKVKLSSVDIVHDLDIIPYPFDENEIDEIYCSHVLEHLSDFNRVMEELHRISKPDAIIKIRGPYFKSHVAFGDSTHKHFLTENSFNYFNDNHPFNYYSTARFDVLKVELVAPGIRKFVPFKRIMNFFLWNIFHEIYYELRVVKKNSSIPKGDKGFSGERNDVTRSPDEKEKFEHLYRYQNVQDTIKPNQRILDVGCGTGYGTQLFFNGGHEVMGIDVSDQAIIYSNSSFPGPEYFICNAESLPFKKGIFDVVTAFESIEHLQDANSGIKEIKRVLKNQGDLFISTPNPKHLKNILKNIIFRIPIPEKVDMNNVYHIREFTYDEFRSFLNKNGFNILSVYGQSIPYIPVLYKKRIFDLAKYFPRYAWTIVIHATNLDD